MTLELVVVAVVVAGGVAFLVWELRRRDRDATALKLIALFGPSIERVQLEPRTLPTWAAVARTTRRLFPEAFARLDAASQGPFPFPPALIERAHARWTTEWLAWEREHDLRYKRLASEVEAERVDVTDERGRVLEARLREIEQEKLQRYQERYEEYVRVGKAIGELEQSSGEDR